MRDYQTKGNAGGAPDTISSTRFGAGEFNSIAVELENAVSTSGQSLAPSDGTGEVANQLAKALSIYGAGGGSYYVDTGAVNAYVLNPVSPKVAPSAYFNGFTVIFEPGTDNTSASTVNIASLGLKSITSINGSALIGGEISGATAIKYNSVDDRFEIVFSAAALLNLNSSYIVDASQADQGVTSSNPNTMTIYDVMTLVGVNKKAVIRLVHNPASGNSTEYLVDTNIDMSNYPNLIVKPDQGAVLNYVTGDETMTFYSPENLDAGMRQQITSVDMIRFFKGGSVYSDWWGCKADNGTTDNGPPLTLAGIAARTGSLSRIKLNSGYYGFDTTAEMNGFFNIEGEGVTSRLFTDANIPIIEIDTSIAQVVGSSIKKLLFRDDNSGTRTGVAGIKITGTTSNDFAYNRFEDLTFEGTYHGIYCDKNTNVGGENKIDWNTFTNIKTLNNGSNQVEYGLYFYNGSGTGNLITNSSFVINTTGLYWGGNNGANVGDITIANNQFGGNGTGVYGSSGAAYRNNIMISSCQFDGGILIPIALDGYGHLKLSGNILGGNGSDIPNCQYINGNGNFHGSTASYGFEHTGIAIDATIDLFDLTLHTSYSAVLVDIISSGLMVDAGTATTVSRYMIMRNNANQITVTQISTNKMGVTTALITHGTSVTNNTITFQATIDSVSAGSNLDTFVLATGRYYEIVEA